MAKETVAALSLPGTLLAWALVVAWVLSQTLMMLGLYWKKAPAPAKYVPGARRTLSPHTHSHTTHPSIVVLSRA